MDEDWNHMLDFADKLLIHADDHSQKDDQSRNMDDFVSERISIIHFDHALELFMKAYLIKKGYLIYTMDNKKIHEGIKKSTSIIKIMNKNRTLNFTEILELFSKTSQLLNGEKPKITDFHELRNKIQHMALSIPVDKGEKIKNFKPIIRSVYKRAFADRGYPLE